MRPRHTPIWPTLALLISIAPGIGRAADIAWPEAVGRLAGERTKAETCAALLKGYGDKQRTAQGQLAYGEAKADFDAVIAELVTALTEGGNPKSLPSLETKLERGASGLGEFCKSVTEVLAGRTTVTEVLGGGTRSLRKGVVEGIEPVIKARKHHWEYDASTRGVIQKQLEAAKWPEFGEVAAAQ